MLCDVLIDQASKGSRALGVGPAASLCTSLGPEHLNVFGSLQKDLAHQTIILKALVENYTIRLVQRFSRSVALNVFPPSSVPVLCCQINNI